MGFLSPKIPEPKAPPPPQPEVKGPVVKEDASGNDTMRRRRAARSQFRRFLTDSPGGSGAGVTLPGQ